MRAAFVTVQKISAINKTWNMEHSGTFWNIPEQGKLSQNKWKKIGASIKDNK